ncbi:P-loop NTPase [Promethearchaeum syntrophicum]|uniref:P-loop NTPase n=1 Tax=Promethearchaeum syntrophicum TaxID=2594042 RepID=A0A5B9D683_9ARCH|nr:ATP-binding protein [Candidatus Prometheoarchaeum syntrophicum]QEE14604.1 Indolepyruvate oxidoreductase subunit IorA [Candidatus Prometheoarchaeum syntrophicum]
MAYHLGIVSGKGGVGKTSITASIACLLAEEGLPVIAVDTDVDAPNLAILFQAKNNQVQEFHVKTTEKAAFIPEKCVHCKLCIDDAFCHFDALKWDEDNLIPKIDSIVCEGCGACKIFCPESAFEVEPVNSGTINHLKSIYNFDVITGETILGAQTSGKLVTELRKYADEVAKNESKDIMIIDGPPGIGCPVIAMLTGLDYVIVIIEPTTAALHDADRVISVINNFNIPFGIIINKSDMYLEGNKRIKEYLNKNKIELLGEIPLDSEWPYAIAKGIPIIKDHPNGISAQNLKKISKKINVIIKEKEK